MGNTVGHWRSSEARRAFEEAYAVAMELLPTPTRAMDIETRFGVVRMYSFGPTTPPAPTSSGLSDEPGKAPVVMCPGRSFRCGDVAQEPSGSVQGS